MRVFEHCSLHNVPLRSHRQCVEQFSKIQKAFQCLEKSYEVFKACLKEIDNKEDDSGNEETKQGEAGDEDYVDHDDDIDEDDVNEDYLEKQEDEQYHKKEEDVEEDIDDDDEENVAEEPKKESDHGNGDEGLTLKDIHMTNFNIFVEVRDLIKDGSITLSYGRHYGLMAGTMV